LSTGTCLRAASSIDDARKTGVLVADADAESVFRPRD
jgi:hypothetical protein